MGSCQFTKVSPLTEAGAAVPWHHTGRPVPRPRRGGAVSVRLRGAPRSEAPLRTYLCFQKAQMHRLWYSITSLHNGVRLRCSTCRCALLVHTVCMVLAWCMRSLNCVGVVLRGHAIRTQAQSSSTSPTLLSGNLLLDSPSPGSRVAAAMRADEQGGWAYRWRLEHCTGKEVNGSGRMLLMGPCHNRVAGRLRSRDMSV